VKFDNFQIWSDMDQKFSKNSKDPKFVATINYKTYKAGAFVKANKK